MASLWSSPPLLQARTPGEGPSRRRITAQRLRLGRDPSNDLIFSDPTISRRHADLLWDGAELSVEDAGSSGGTFVNGARINRCTLRPGDLLRLGPRQEFEIVQESATSSFELSRLAAPEQEVRHLQTLLEVARALNAATVLDEVLQVVLRAAVRLVGADRASLVLVAEDGSRLGLVSYPESASEQSAAAESPALRQAIATRRTVVARREQGDDLGPQDLAEVIASPLLVARRPLGPPLEASFVAKVEVLGGLLLERRSAGRGFDRPQLAIFESLAADAAVAIDSARLYREAREKAKIEHEMALARTLQAALLREPPQVPFAEVAAYFHPAASVGGDLYFGATRPDGALALGLGDVSGKGVGAALWMALAQGLLGLLHDLGHSTAELLPLLNRNLLSHNPGNRFLTLTTANLFPDGQLELASAGHCPALLVRRTGGIEEIPSQGPPLGLLAEAKWGTSRQALAPGDSLVLYSDGISESFAPDGEEFGVEGIRASLVRFAGAEPAHLAQAILAAAARHRGEREAGDDITLLVVRYGSAGQLAPTAPQAIGE